MNLSNDHTLGNLLGEFRWNKGITLYILIIWVVIFFPSLLLALSLFGVPTLILSIYSICQSCIRLLTFKPVLLAYEYGLIDRRQRKRQVIRYEEIKKLYISAVMFKYLITIETHNKKKIKINEHLKNTDHLRIILEEQIIQQQLPELIALYQHGDSISFDQIQVSQAGLMTGKLTLPWSEFSRVDVQRVDKFVYLMIFKKDNKQEWAAVRRNYFPNMALFLALLDYIKKTQLCQ